jgi:hypothetical protein
MASSGAWLQLDTRTRDDAVEETTQLKRYLAELELKLASRNCHGTDQGPPARHGSAQNLARRGA